VTTGGRTALVVVMREAEPVVSPWRHRFLRATVDRGIPAHVTVLFPFVPVATLDDDVTRALRELYAPLTPFRCDLASVESFPGYVWLAPEPAARFVELIELTCRAFPAYPPYGEPEIEPIPHCTVGAEEDATALAEMLGVLRRELAPRLPIRSDVGAISLLEERDDETWFERESFALAGGR
jgi:2'-5' RNA ligase